MQDDNRTHAASTLRAFFDEQILHLHDLVHSHIHHSQQQTDEDQRIVDSFVDAANSKMRAVHGYAEKLREQVCGLHNHVLQVAERIPPPVDLTGDAFTRNSLINALFVNAHDIEGLFRGNPELDHYLRGRKPVQTPIVYALLTANMAEKSVLGVGMLENMLVRDVPQQTVNFSAHKLHIPCASSAELSTGLRRYLFDRVVALIKQEMTSRMIGQDFERGDNSYESRINSLANPDVYLNTLIQYLERPANLISIDTAHFKLSKLGIKLNSADMQCANEFDIHQLTWSDRTRNVVLQIAYWL